MEYEFDNHSLRVCINKNRVLLLVRKGPKDKREGGEI